MNNSFPFSKNILIFRDWRDVLISRYRFSGHRPIDIARDIAIYLNIVSHASARLDSLVAYESLVTRPDDILPTICDTLGISYDMSYLSPLRWHAAPTPERDLTSAKRAEFSWRADYKGYITKEITQIVAPALARFHSRYSIDTSTMKAPSLAPSQETRRIAETAHVPRQLIVGTVRG